MKGWILWLLTLLIGFTVNANAETVGLFPSEVKGTVVIQNGKTTDADFLWNILSVVPVETGLKQVKSVESASGDFKAVCNRVDTHPAPTTSCTLNFTSVNSSGKVIISKGEGKISGAFTGEIAQIFNLSENVMTSPDGLLTLCSNCENDGTESPFSIIWQN